MEPGRVDSTPGAGGAVEQARSRGRTLGTRRLHRARGSDGQEQERGATFGRGPQPARPGPAWRPGTRPPVTRKPFERPVRNLSGFDPRQRPRRELVPSTDSDPLRWGFLPGRRGAFTTDCFSRAVDLTNRARSLVQNRQRPVQRNRIQLRRTLILLSASLPCGRVSFRPSAQFASLVPTQTLCPSRPWDSTRTIPSTRGRQTNINPLGHRG